THKKPKSLRNDKILQKKIIKKNKSVSKKISSDLDTQSNMSYGESLYEDPYHTNQNPDTNYTSTSQILHDCITEDGSIPPTTDINQENEIYQEDQELFTLDEASTATTSRYNLRSVGKLLTGF